MARRVMTEFVDDLTGGKAEGTVAFGLDGKTYEIDLSKTNAAALRKALAPYIEAGRSIRPGRQVATLRTRGGRSDLEAIRQWASANGHTVAARGRIAASVIEAYDAAN